MTGYNRVLYRMNVFLIALAFLIGLPNQLQADTSIKAKAGPPPLPSTTCASHLDRSARPPRLFENLKSANLYIDFPKGLQHALECRGHERECATHDVPSMATDALEAIERHTTRLKDLNDGYPQVLYPDRLLQTLRPLYKNAVTRFIPRELSGRVPEPTIFNPFSDQYASRAATPDVFNFMLTVTLIDDTKPKLVVLTRTLFRYGNEVYYPPDPPMSTAIPLDLPEKDIDERVTFFMKIAMNYFSATSAGRE